ncbi:uncharacterized protein LOC131242515 [Magnolia sinica]|uniref:uncharacterized protein LOC131242515 n=1 Tax=Magnolia sinica TaxID=86752 RepID=UPI00265B526B|nr:uncharacterized protein LOC131242515 [Magnolia sinica]
MEALLSQFSLLARQALEDKSFDPTRIEELMELFESEAYQSWAAMEAEGQKEVQEAEISMREAEDYLNSLMDTAMDDFERFSKELDRSSKAELSGLTRAADAVKKSGDLLGNSMTVASKKYMDAALLAATASMKTAWNGFSNTSSKVHPS